MLLISGAISLLLLLAANRAVCRGGQPVSTIIVGTVLSFFALLCLAMPFLVLPQGVLLLVAYGVCRAGRLSAPTFALLSTVVTLLPYGVVGGWQYSELARLRARYPYESVAERLAQATPAAPGGELSSLARARLEELEETLDQGSRWRRGFLLKQLHEHTIEVFIMSPGFGVTRMPRYPNERTLAVWPLREPTPRQPGFDDSPSWSPGLTPDGDLPNSMDLLKTHDDGVRDFVHAQGFGYVKDRRHVAGFEPHQFSRVPAPAESWSVERLDLVSLLLHEGTVAYVSSRLPKMDELREVPTRALDDFEAGALANLRAGEDLVVRSSDAGVRMLGSLRAVKQCLSCHDGERGSLLGAFSYTLRPARR